MTTIGDKVILSREWVLLWLHYELRTARDYKSSPDKLTYHQTLLEGALGILELCPEDFKAIMSGAENPEDEELLGRALRAVDRLFDPKRKEDENERVG